MPCVTIRLIIEGTDQHYDLRAASSLLHQHSSYFRAALDFSTRLADATDASNGQILVFATRENAWCMPVVLRYMQNGHIEDDVQAHRQDLLLLLQYADYLGCEGLIQECLQCLLRHMQGSECPLFWTIITYFQRDNIPDAISHSPVWRDCCQVARLYAVAAMQDMVGTAGAEEYVLDCLEGCKRLVSLNHETLLHICRGCSTRVAYESSIVAAITLWYAAHPTASQQQLNELASTVCLQGLPRMYMASVLGRLPWWKQALGEGVLLQAMQLLRHVENAEEAVTSLNICSRKEGSTRAWDMSGRLEHHGNSKALRCRLDSMLQYMPTEERNLYKLLLRQPREPSGIRRLVLTAGLTQDQLQQAYAANGTCNSTWNTACGWKTFAGIHWQLMYRLLPGGASQSSTWQLYAGVRFNIPGILDQDSVSIQLPNLHLQHPLAVAPHPPLTRLQTSTIGFDPTTASYLLPGGAVLACLEVLPLRWCQPDCGQQGVRQFSRYLDVQGCLPLEVVIERLL